MSFIAAVLAGWAAGSAWGEAAGWFVFFALVCFGVEIGELGTKISEALEGLKDED